MYVVGSEWNDDDIVDIPYIETGDISDSEYCVGEDPVPLPVNEPWLVDACGGYMVSAC
jgi:hypothetical protein